MTTDQKSPDYWLNEWDSVNFSDPPDIADLAEALRRAIKERDEALLFQKHVMESHLIPVSEMKAKLAVAVEALEEFMKVEERELVGFSPYSLMVAIRKVAREALSKIKETK